MAFVAGIILMYLPEEPAFRMLARLLDERGPNLRRLYLPGLEVGTPHEPRPDAHSLVDLLLLNELLDERGPNLRRLYLPGLWGRRKRRDTV